jgi:prepilin-type N-terminal cleavage/methylation domain-containing protein
MRGFTLLEMLVVLVILGMAAALVAPSLGRTLERVTAAGERDEMARRLAQLPAAVRAEGRGRAWRAGEAVALDTHAWPPGWRVTALTPLRVEASGFCAGGEVQAQGEGGAMRLRLEAPDCRTVDADAP